MKGIFRLCRREEDQRFLCREIRRGCKRGKKKQRMEARVYDIVDERSGEFGKRQRRGKRGGKRTRNFRNDISFKRFAYTRQYYIRKAAREVFVFKGRGARVFKSLNFGRWKCRERIGPTSSIFFKFFHLGT